MIIPASHTLNTLVELIIAFLIAAVVIRLAAMFAKRILRFAKLPGGMVSILSSILRIILWITAIVVILIHFDFNRYAVYFSGSTVILLFIFTTGAASLIADTVAGITLASDRHFRIGSMVRAGDKGTEGEVIGMDVRKTRIKDAEGLIHVIPNSLIEKNEWVVLGKKK